MTECRECGMPVPGGQYHPYAACLMFKACRDSRTVLDNLDAVKADGYAFASAEIEHVTKCRDLVFRYIDRLNDPAECDLLHDIVAEFVTSFNEIVEQEDLPPTKDSPTWVGVDLASPDSDRTVYSCSFCGAVFGDHPPAHHECVTEQDTRKYKFRAGDIVRHLPTDETWTLAFGDREDKAKMVAAAGWPCTVTHPSHCELVKAASDEKSAKMLADCAAMKDGGDVRAIVARGYLAETEKNSGTSD